MILRKKELTAPACEPGVENCHTSERSTDVPLFERPWDEFVIKRGEDGKYRNFTQCCGYLTPA